MRKFDTTYMEEAFSGTEEKAREAVMRDTWGHLAAKKDWEYDGWLVFAYTCFRSFIILDYEFAELDDSPWLHDALNEYIDVFITANEIEPGTVISVSGPMINYELTGEVEILHEPAPEAP